MFKNSHFYSFSVSNIWFRKVLCKHILCDTTAPFFLEHMIKWLFLFFYSCLTVYISVNIQDLILETKIHVIIFYSV